MAYRLAQAMAKKRLNGIELARRSGVSNCSISSYLNGRCEPTRHTAMKLAMALGVSVNWLLGVRDIEDVQGIADGGIPEALTDAYMNLTDANKEYLMQTVMILHKAQGA